MSEECCEVSRQLAHHRKRQSEAETKWTESTREAGTLRAQLREISAERDDWRMRATTLAISYPDSFTPSFVELAEWRVLGQQILRDAVYWDDCHRGNWACQHCAFTDHTSDTTHKSEKFSHDSAELCGKAAALLGAAS